MQFPPQSTYGPSPSLGQPIPNAPLPQHSEPTTDARANFLPPSGALHLAGHPPIQSSGPPPNGMPMQPPSMHGSQIMMQQHQQRFQGPALGQGFHPPPHPVSPMAGAPYGDQLPPGVPGERSPYDAVNGVGRQSNSMPPSSPQQQFNMGPTPPPIGSSVPPSQKYGGPIQSRYPGPINSSGYFYYSFFRLFCVTQFPRIKLRLILLFRSPSTTWFKSEFQSYADARWSPVRTNAAAATA